MSHPMSYQGNDPFIFISYSHQDSQKVLPILAHLSDEGFRVWYDGGIRPGSEWPEDIGERVMSAECMIAFLSAHYVESNHCKREITFALHLNKPILVIYLEEPALSPGMQMQLVNLQAMYLDRYDSRQSYLDALVDAPILQNSRERAHSDYATWAQEYLSMYEFPTLFVYPKEKQWDINTVWEPEDEPDHQAYVRTEDANYQDVLDLAIMSYYEKDYEDARKGFELAAICGIPAAMTWLGKCYHSGHGVSWDPEQAFHWFKSAAINGDPWGTYFFGYFIKYGSYDVVEKDYWKGISILRKAAELGSPHAMWDLGDEYDQGFQLDHDMPHDPQKAQYWFSKAAKIAGEWAQQGDPIGMFCLGAAITAAAV